MSPEFKRYIRSIHGQLHLFGLVFLGAIGLSVATWIARPYLFEPYISQVVVKQTAGMERLAASIVAGTAGQREVEHSVKQVSDQLLEQVVKKSGAVNEDKIASLRATWKEKLQAQAVDQVVSSLYWLWLDKPEWEGSERLLEPLLRAYPELTGQNLRRTVVVGNLEQRKRAFEGLVQARQMGLAEAEDVATYAKQKANRRGETELLQQYRELEEKLLKVGLKFDSAE